MWCTIQGIVMCCECGEFAHQPPQYTTNSPHFCSASSAGSSKPVINMENERIRIKDNQLQKLRIESNKWIEIQLCKNLQQINYSLPYEQVKGNSFMKLLVTPQLYKHSYSTESACNYSCNITVERGCFLTIQPCVLPSYNGPSENGGPLFSSLKTKVVCALTQSYIQP